MFSSSGGSDPVSPRPALSHVMSDCSPALLCFALLSTRRRHGLRLTMCSFTSSLLLYALCPGIIFRLILALLSSSERPDIAPIKITRGGRVPLSSLVTALLRRSLVPQLRPATSSYPSVQRCISLFCAVLCSIALYCAVLCFPIPMPLQSISTLPFLHNCAPATTSHSIAL